MAHSTQSYLARAISLLLLLLVAAFVIFWWRNVGQTDLASVRQTLSEIIKVETAFFALTIAGLAFVSNVLSNQSKRLEHIREKWIAILVAAPDTVLDEINEIYQQKFREEKSLPANYKYLKVSHLRDVEIIKYLPAIISYRKAVASNNLTNLDPDPHEIDANPMLLFRISCAVLLSNAWDARLKSDQIGMLANKLKDIDRTENVVTLINNIYDSRLAASRGLPIFVFFTLASLVATLIVLSVLSSQTYSQWLYGITILPIIVITIFAGYYILQILKRYF